MKTMRLLLLVLLLPIAVSFGTDPVSSDPLREAYVSYLYRMDSAAGSRRNALHENFLELCSEMINNAVSFPPDDLSISLSDQRVVELVYGVYLGDLSYIEKRIKAGDDEAGKARGLLRHRILSLVYAYPLAESASEKERLYVTSILSRSYVYLAGTLRSAFKNKVSGLSQTEAVPLLLVLVAEGDEKAKDLLEKRTDKETARLKTLFETAVRYYRKKAEGDAHQIEPASSVNQGRR